ncbi:MAG TPA: hypothetical protein VHX63_12230 [Acidobacteriaceae bacterium]|nr:hypothetical protein [Acidobacteriaceae bacterium]
MKLFRLLPLLLLFSSLGAIAQVGLYGEFSAAKLNVPNTGWIYGPTFGGYYDPAHFAFFRAGLDARAAFLGTGSTELYSGLVGPRLVVGAPALPAHVYVESLVGVGHAEAGEGVAKTSATKFEYQFLGGVDLTVLPRIDWRVAEFSYGGLSGLNSSFNPKILSTGIVVRLP